MIMIQKTVWKVVENQNNKVYIESSIDNVFHLFIIYNLDVHLSSTRFSNIKLGFPKS